MYEVTLRIKVEPGPTFEEKRVTVRAYDANDAMMQAFFQADDPRADKILKIEPADNDELRLAHDLGRMLGDARPG